MKFTIPALSTILFFLSISISYAHFGIVIPSDNMVMQTENRTLSIDASFSHPLEMIGMDLAKPKTFVVKENGKTHDLLPKLTEKTIMGHKAWSLSYPLKMPGVYMFCMEPKPYFEPGEDCYIIHYTKTVVAAFGDNENWDAEAGLKTEIVPLSMPFAQYAGNLFRGVVKVNGKAVPFATVEVEYYNKDKKVTAPNDYMVTQTVKADQNGVFAYTVPRSGWWGFAALTTADYTLKYEGQDKDVEQGAVIWVHFEDWQEK